MVAPSKESALQGKQTTFQTSWIDRLVQWIDRLPGPSWVFYVVGVLALTLLINAILWIDRSVPLGSFGSIEGVFPPFVFYFLALYHYLTRIGSRSLRDFHPLLNEDETALAQIDYKLTTLPPWAGWLSIVSAVVTLPPFFSSGQAFGDSDPNTALPYIVAAVAAVFFGATIFALIIRSIRQLRMVHRLHSQATNINLLNLEPAHAFSRLTARTGIGLILLLVLGYLYNPSSFHGGYLVAAYLLMAAPAVVVFVVPVIGIRDRLVEEKKRVLNETIDLLQMTSDNQEDKIRNRDYEGLAGMETAVKALIRKREMLEGTPTWPWNPGTIRGFASTLLLPIFLRLVFWLLERFL